MYWNIYWVCYNQTRDVMKKTKISVFAKLNNIEENNEFLAIKGDNVIKYIDLANNRMTIDMNQNIIVRENKDYVFNINFDSNKIAITMKKNNITLEKDIKTLVVSKSLKEYLVRYLLTDENVINEYYVKFWNKYCIIMNKMI